jgi:hypothetical protein
MAKYTLIPIVQSDKFIFNNIKLFNAETETKHNTLSERSLLDYLIFYFHIV